MGTASAAAMILGVSPDTARAQSVSSGSTGGTETVIVTGARQEAVDAKKNATAVIDIAPLDQIRSLPDANAAEALQRLPGVSMESDTGEGRFVNIRGMDADLNGTTYDGVRLTASNPASPQSGARAVAFDAFPASILGGVEVVKSLTPDMDAGGLGGVVNILPRAIAPGQDHIFDASIGGGIESLRNTPVYKGDITIGKRFGLSSGDDRFSIILSYGYEQDHRSIDDVEEDYINDPTTVPPGTSAFLSTKPYDDLQRRYYQYSRLRQGYGGALTFSPDADSTLYVRGLHAGYTETANKHEFVITGMAGDILSANNTTGDFAVDSAVPEQRMIATSETLGNNLIEVGGNTLIANTIKMDARASWTEGFNRFPYSMTDTFVDPNTVSLVYNNLNASFPTVRATDGTVLPAASNYTQFNGNNSPSRNSDAEDAGVVNFAMPLGFDDNGGVLKFGASVRERTRKAQAYASDYIDNGYTLSQFAVGPDTLYYDGHYDIGPQANFRALQTLPQTAVTADPSTYEDDNENVYAGYVQYGTSVGQFDLTGGVRVEGTSATYRANAIDQDGNVTPSVANRSYTNFFPDISAKYAVSDELQLRAAFTTAIARPGFNQISAAKSIDYVNDIVSQGNPNLKPTLGRNFDLSASYFLPEGGLASVGLFYKAFSDYIIPTAQLDVKTYPDPRLTGLNVQLDSFQNIGAAHADGVELAYNQKFLFLPDPLSDFGFDGNFTYVDFNGQIRTGEEHALPQTSPLNYNAGIFYDKGPLYVKVAASFVSRNLWSVGSDASTDLYSQSRLRLDIGSTYDINEEVQLYFDAKNLTNTHLEFTQTASANYPVQREFYEPDYLFGVRVKM